MVLVALLVAATVGGVGPAHAAVPACGSTITADTTLTADLSCPGDGLVVAAPNVILDLGGHTIDGAGFAAGAAGVRVIGGATGVTVKAGRIQDFRFGVAVDRDAPGASLTGLTLAGAGDGANVASAGTTLRANRFLANSGSALVLTGADALVRGNVLYDNAAGMLIVGSSRSSIVANQIVGDGGEDGGIFLFGAYTGVKVSANVVTRYIGRSAISVTGGVDTEVSANQVFGNRRGIVVDGGTARVFGNVAVANTDDGIEIVPGRGAAVLTANSAHFNGGLGINAPAAADGGGNRASANGDPRQCTGVVCT